MRILIIIVCILSLTACANSPYPNTSPIGKLFPSIKGESLDKKTFTIPNDFTGEISLLLIGYKQDSQFDIDRWLIGLDMTQTQVAAYELPTIKGLAPRMFKSKINQGMRNGIPPFLWNGVITVYEDGDLVQQFTGNELPNNARIILLDSNGKIRYFYDRGFSVKALNQLRAILTELKDE